REDRGAGGAEAAFAGRGERMSDGGKGIRKRVSRLLSSPDEELGRWGRTVKNSLRFAQRAAQELFEDRAPLMAAALAFRTVFSLIPVLVVAVVGLQAFYGPDSIESSVGEVLDYLGLANIQIEEQLEGPPAPGEDSLLAAPRGDDAGARSVAEWVESLVLRVQEINFAAIGAVGVGLLIYAAFSLLVEVERAFNIVFSAARGRRTMERIVNYWAILTLAPIALASSFFIGAQLNEQVGTSQIEGLLKGISVIVPFLISWLMLSLAYSIIPNTRVSKPAALVGAFVGALLWELGKWGFQTYVDYSTTYAKFYGSLALIPIFLLWIYITWLVVLFGLEIAYVTQTFRSSDRHRKPSAATKMLIDPAVTVALMALVADSFDAGEAPDAADLADASGLPDELTVRILNALVDAELLRRVEGEGERTAFALARPADAINADEALEVGRKLSSSYESGNGHVYQTIDAIRRVAMEEASRHTLAELLANVNGGARNRLAAVAKGESR
ncbi:MAG: YihY/virulence factor BrkB family protein, partial [Planctomycetota bacterium]|nr:YihY/virulence factor BrkB family protein [Planctomycetota bacterium]